MQTLLYNTIICPLYLFFEFVFVKGYNLTGNHGITIVILSITINLLVLPLYRRADAMQEEQRQKEKSMKKWVDHIKKTFHGDERYLMLQTYYDQCHYHQTDSLKGMASLILQIPFFIAAYQFLSNLQQLQGVSFGFLKDLGRADALFTVGSFQINIMPIIMTGINILSGAIYTKGMSVKTKVQLYGMALFFLVLLYKSPSGLLLYWTLNNLFSLVKNIIYKLKQPRKTVAALLSVTSGAVLLWTFLGPRPLSVRQKVFVFVICLLLLSLAVWNWMGIKVIQVTKELREENSWRLIILGGVYLTLLIGGMIPLSVIASSPGDFIRKGVFYNPLGYSYYTLTVAAGFFIVWISVFYLFSEGVVRQLFPAAVWILAGSFTINYLFFGQKMGNMSPELVYDTLPYHSLSEQLINLLVLTVVIMIQWSIFKRKKKIILFVYSVMLVGALGISGKSAFTIHAQAQELAMAMTSDTENEFGIPLSKNGKNVILFMLDRSINPYLPYLFQEKPELKRQFEGFTYYSNTVSMGTSTNTGSAELFGGYEYSPFEMNKRNAEALEDKHNEALKVLPVLFSQNNYHVTVCDPPYAGYQSVSDLSIYDDYPDIHAFHTIGRFTEEYKDSLQRSFLGYSLMKVMPLAMQRSFYDQGNYNNSDTEEPDYSELFIDSYSVLEKLPSVTEVKESDENTFFMIDNETVHEPCWIQLPEYEPRIHVDMDVNQQYEQEHADRYVFNNVLLKTETDWQQVHYYSHMAAFLKLGEWMDYLREQGVYDNTRIIIVSDHGYGLRNFDNMILENGFDTEWFTPMLMVKDFNSSEWTEKQDFMTNADAPYLAVEGLIEPAVNPFTGNQISDQYKKEHDELILFHTNVWQVDQNNGNMFAEDESNFWFKVHDNIHDLNNWTIIDNPFR